jgi:hypothetical protein
MQLMDNIVHTTKNESSVTELLATLAILVARDIQIPVDLQARLVGQGIDVEAILNKRR